MGPNDLAPSSSPAAPQTTPSGAPFPPPDPAPPAATSPEGLAQRIGELEHTVAELSALLEVTDTGALLVDRELRVTRVSPALRMLFPLALCDLGRPLAEVPTRLENPADQVEAARHVLFSGQPHESQVRDALGRWFLRRIQPYYDARRQATGLILSFTPIDFLKHEQAKLDAALASSRLVWWDWDIITDRLATHGAEHCLFDCNAHPANPSVQAWFRFVHPDDIAQVRTSLDAALATKSGEWECEHRLLSSEKTWRWVQTHGRVIERAADGRPQRMLGTTQDVHVRKVAEQQVLRLREAIEHTDASIVITDAAGRIEFVNAAFCRVTGYTREEVLGQNPRFLKSDRHSREFYATMWETLARGEVWRGEITNRRRDGSLYTERASITPVRGPHGSITHFVAVKDDITAFKAEEEHRQLLETQLAQAQKMETLGTLAGGIAHDFNNILTGILGYTRIARASIPVHHEATAALDAVERGGQRAADLVRRILAFSRRDPPSRAPFVPAQRVEDLLPMLRTSLPRSIEVESRRLGSSTAILADAGQFEQVVLNLCTNSGQAIGLAPGHIWIDYADITLSQPLAVEGAKLPPGNYVCLTISDDGPGIDPTVLPRIFEPFFTTKERGQGTGLGLSIVHNILISHGGGVTVRSRRGLGTEFALYFPAAAHAELAQPAGVDSAEKSGPSRLPPELAGATVFIVDDESFVAEITAMSFDRLGLKTRIFSDAAPCLATLLAEPGAAQLLVTDQTMPGMTGVELLRALRAHGNFIPTIIISGFTRSISSSTLASFKPCCFVAKPFTLDNLLSEAGRLCRMPL